MIDTACVCLIETALGASSGVLIQGPQLRGDAANNKKHLSHQCVVYTFSDPIKRLCKQSSSRTNQWQSAFLVEPESCRLPEHGPGCRNRVRKAGQSGTIRPDDASRRQTSIHTLGEELPVYNDIPGDQAKTVWACRRFPGSAYRTNPTG